MSRDDDSLLGRWSRRKRAVAAEAEASSGPAVPASAPRPEEGPPGPDEGLTEPELLEKLGLPDPDTLQPGDDFKAFMARHVPEFLRQRALRRLWASNPVLANVDGLVDYGGDFTDAATVPKVLQTAYRVGKGFFRDIAETDRDAALPDAVDVAAVGDVGTDAPVPVAAQADDGAGHAGDSTPAAPDPAPAEPSEDTPPALRPRRMAFRTG